MFRIFSKQLSEEKQKIEDHQKGIDYQTYVEYLIPLYGPRYEQTLNWKAAVALFCSASPKLQAKLKAMVKAFELTDKKNAVLKTWFADLHKNFTEHPLSPVVMEESDKFYNTYCTKHSKQKKNLEIVLKRINVLHNILKQVQQYLLKGKSGQKQINANTAEESISTLLKSDKLDNNTVNTKNIIKNIIKTWKIDDMMLNKGYWFGEVGNLLGGTDTQTTIINCLKTLKTYPGCTEQDKSNSNNNDNDSSTPLQSFNIEDHSREESNNSGDTQTTISQCLEKLETYASGCTEQGKSNSNNNSSSTSVLHSFNNTANTNIDNQLYLLLKDQDFDGFSKKLTQHSKSYNVNTTDKSQKTLLHHAADINSEPRFLELLLQKGANPNIGDNKGWTPLHTAAFLGQLECVLLFINNKSVDWQKQKTDEDQTCLDIAVLGKTACSHLSDKHASVIEALEKVQPKDTNTKCNSITKLVTDP